MRSSDTESADCKAQKKRFAFNFPGIFTRSKQAAGDAEAAGQGADGADDGNDDAARSEATVIIEDDPPKGVSAGGSCWDYDYSMTN